MDSEFIHTLFIDVNGQVDGTALCHLEVGTAACIGILLNGNVTCNFSAFKLELVVICGNYS